MAGEGIGAPVGAVEVAGAVAGVVAEAVLAAGSRLVYPRLGCCHPRDRSHFGRVRAAAAAAAAAVRVFVGLTSAPRHP